jgi:hypothetical protein
VSEVYTLDKANVFRAYGYVPRTSEVIDFHNSTARTRAPVAPARTSKSYSAAFEAIYHCFPSHTYNAEGKIAWIPEPTGERRIWLIGPDYKTLKEWDYVWEALVSRKRRNPLGNLYKIVARANSVHQGNLRIVMEMVGGDVDGNPVRVVVEGKSSSSPESLQGEQVYLALLSEAAEHDEKILARYLGTRTKYMLLPTTPKNSAAWLKELIEEGREHPELSTESFRYTPHANPHYNWDVYWMEHAKAESRVHGEIITPPHGHDCFAKLPACAAHDDPWFAEQFQGEWTGAAERLLPFRDHHVLAEVPEWVTTENPPIFVSCDYGYADGQVALWWAVGPGRTYVIFAEEYTREVPAHQWVNAIHDRSRDLGVSPEFYVGDPKQPQVAHIMREHGLPVWDRHKKAMADRAAGGQALVDALSHDPATNAPRLHVVGGSGEPFGCPRTINEWKRLSRKPGTTAKEWSDSAVMGDDHAFDAARYGIMARGMPRHVAPENEIREYIAAVRRRERRKPSLPSARLVGGSPRNLQRSTVNA